MTTSDIISQVAGAAGNSSKVFAESDADSVSKVSACALMLQAEKLLSIDEKYEEGLTAATAALQSFKDAGDDASVVDALRLIVNCYKSKREYVLLEQDGEVRAEQVLDEAEDIVQRALDTYHATSDDRGISAMLLSMAEINSRRRDNEKRKRALTQALDAQTHLVDVPDLKLRASACMLTSSLQVKKGLLPDAIQNAKDAISAFQELGDVKAEAKASHVHALVLFANDMFHDAMQASKRALELFRTVGVPKLVAFELLHLADWHMSRGKTKEAISFAEEALDLFKKMKYGKNYQASCLRTLVNAHIGSGSVQRALEFAKQGISEFAAVGDLRGQAMVLEAVVCAEMEGENQDGAMAAASEMVRISKQLGDKRMECQSLRSVSTVNSRFGDKADAVQALREALSISKDIGDLFEEASICEMLVHVYVQSDDIASALTSAEEQRDLCFSCEDVIGETQAMLSVANLRAMKQDMGSAMGEAAGAFRKFRELGDQSGQGDALLLMAELHQVLGEFDQALEAAIAAKNHFKAKGNLRKESKAQSMAARIHIAEKANLQAAVKAANEALVLIRKAEDRSGEVPALLLFSQALAGQAMEEASKAGDAARSLIRVGGKAVRAAQDAVKIAKRGGNRHVVADATYNLGNMQMVAAQFDEALLTADACALGFRELHDKRGEIAAVLLRAEVHSLTGRKEQAKDLAIRAVASAKDCNDEAGELRAVVLLERLAGQQQQKTEKQEEQTLHVGASTKTAASEELAPTMSQAEVEGIVIQCARDATGDDSDISLDVPLMDSGLDSLSSVAFRNDLQKHLNMKLPASLIFDFPTARAIIGEILEMSRSAR